MNTSDRKQELSQFLKTRRARIAPSEVGLPDGQRRRTPGLRREEVAQLAGVGLTWYTWLEQGRDIQVSEDVLLGVAKALRMTSTETNHLFMLAGYPNPMFQSNETEQVAPALYTLVRLQTLIPAVIIGRHWDILVWNALATRILGDFAKMPIAKRNMLWIMFMDEDMRYIINDWEHHAQRLLAHFRLDYGQHIDDMEFEKLRQRLCAGSPLFKAWWELHDIQARNIVHKHFRHPILGDLYFEQITFIPEPAIGQRVINYVPIPNTGTLEVLQNML